ncbi:hypothetical protein ACVTEB_12220 [Vibrio cholerae]|uniref:hypothetical protein n=2 Tax=Vibrio cholerae TaxID=666 RepID=UPI001AA026AF|nr:hypothetical protein [Vibrio cholerae]EJL6466882.1 hypothetical protein [Vibrio cholerae]MBP0925241.1 hypothetical protein [Vibrio cholerae]MCX9490105.1 hypothetical protein [Vibrio cholerae]MCX9521977.1 hypothetical protein [Vibrio cholerae]UZC89470.1 hypothetical protein OFY13_12045 [Vibrio cholerae]
MKLYENVVIGNFLYGLGFSIGQALDEKTIPSMINLLQQTPADKILADVVLEFPGVVRVIEFKNADGSLAKEKEKKKQLELALKNNEYYQGISRRVHWYIETKPFERECVNNIKPYLDAFNDDDSMFTLETFINDITLSVINPNEKIKSEELQAYLSLLKSCQGDGKVGTGGIIVSVSSEGIKYVQFSDIMQLRLQHKEFVQEVKNEYESIMKMSFSKKRSRNLQMERDLGDDWEMSL